MAQAYNKLGLHPVNGNEAKKIMLPVAAAQTFVKGDPIWLVAGLVTLATAASTALAGVAAQNATLLATGTLVEIYCDSDQVYYGCHDADSHAILAGATSDIVGTSGAIYIDTSADAIHHLKNLACTPDDAAATVKARWTCKINRAINQLT